MACRLLSFAPYVIEAIVSSGFSGVLGVLGSACMAEKTQKKTAAKSRVAKEVSKRKTPEVGISLKSSDFLS